MQGFFTKFPMLLSSNGQEQKNSSCLTPTSTLWRSNVVIIKEQCCYSLYYSSTLWRSDVVIIRQLCEGVMLLFVNSVKERLVVIRYIINSVKERCCYSSTLWRSDLLLFVILSTLWRSDLLFVNSVKEQLVVIRYIPMKRWYSTVYTQSVFVLYGVPDLSHQTVHEEWRVYSHVVFVPARIWQFYFSNVRPSI